MRLNVELIGGMYDAIHNGVGQRSRCPSQLLIPAINAQLRAKNERAGCRPVMDELKEVKLLVLGTFDQQLLIHDQKLNSHILLQDLSHSFREEGFGEMMTWVGQVPVLLNTYSCRSSVYVRVCSRCVICAMQSVNLAE